MITKRAPKFCRYMKSNELKFPNCSRCSCLVVCKNNKHEFQHWQCYGAQSKAIKCVRVFLENEIRKSNLLDLYSRQACVRSWWASTTDYVCSSKQFMLTHLLQIDVTFLIRSWQLAYLFLNSLFSEGSLRKSKNSDLTFNCCNFCSSADSFSALSCACKARNSTYVSRASLDFA